MITSTAWTAFLCAGGTVLLALAGLLVTRRGSPARRIAARILAASGVLALGAAYVWLELGPEVDHRLESRYRPLVDNPPPAEMDV